MSLRRNMVLNPAFANGAKNWSVTNTGWGVTGTPAAVPADSAGFFKSKTGLLLEWIPVTGTNGAYTSYNFDTALEAPLPVHAEFKATGVEGETPIRLALEIYAAGVSKGALFSDTATLKPGSPALLSLTKTLPAGIDRIVMTAYRRDKPAAPVSAFVSDALLEFGTAGEYFNGDGIKTGRSTYGWDGTPHASTSYQVDTLDAVHWWTRKWWEFLPSTYRGDRNVNPEMGGYPMLRYMEGVGRIAGEVRDLTDSIWAGEFMNPATAPDSALLWLSQLLGTDEKGRELATPALREYLVDMSAGGRVAVGTKTHIQAIAKNYLTNDRRVAVVPSKERLHSLILVVAENDLPKLDGPAFIAKVRASGVVPAGHEIVVSLAISTWDGWTAAAGATWADLEKTAKTWAESDALGVVLE